MTRQQAFGAELRRCFTTRLRGLAGVSFFFFSSRRRHTRCSRDWSSDVCSSDLVDTIRVRGERPRVVRLEYTEHGPILAEDRARGRAFVVRFVGSEPGTAGYLEIGRASCRERV